MSMQKRKTKINKLVRNKKRRLIAFYSLVIGSSVVFGAGIIFLLFQQSQKPFVISPLPVMRALATNVQEDEYKNGDVPILCNLSESPQYICYLAYCFVTHYFRQTFKKLRPDHLGLKNQFKYLYKYY